MDTLPESDRRAVQRVLDGDIDPESGATHDDLAAVAAVDEPGVGEGDRAIVGGYRLMLDHLVRGSEGALDIQMSRPVTRIADDSDGVTISGDWGSATGDVCIVTVPVGVLQSDRVTFEPPLPEAQRTALARLGMGVVEKVLLQYDARWWPEMNGGYFRWFDDPLTWVEWADLSEATGAPVVAGFITGDALSRCYTGRSDAEIAAAAHDAFTRFVAAG